MDALTLLLFLLVRFACVCEYRSPEHEDDEDKVDPEPPLTSCLSDALDHSVITTRVAVEILSGSMWRRRAEVLFK